jgi:hypothetical protein
MTHALCFPDLWVESAPRIVCKRLESGFPTSYGHPARGLDMLDCNAVHAPTSKRPRRSMRLFTTRPMHLPFVVFCMQLRAVGRCGSIMPTTEACNPPTRYLD